MTEITGYHRKDDGTLERAQLLLDEDTDTLCDPRGYPLTLTDEIAELKGWGGDDGPALVYRNDGARQLLYLVDRDMLEQWLEAGDDAVYEPTADEGIVQLSAAGAALCEAHGLTVDVDSYGCAYCVEHTIR